MDKTSAPAFTRALDAIYHGRDDGQEEVYARGASRSRVTTAMSEQNPEGVGIPLVWVGVEDVPIGFVNAFICQFDQDLSTFIVTLGQANPPALIGTPEQVAEQVQGIEFVQVKPLFRMSLSEARMRELIPVLQANLDQLERARTMLPGDPR